jgi:aconitase A
VLLKLGDDISTDEIMPAGAEVLPLRSNIPAIAEHVFKAVDPEFSQRRKRWTATASLSLPVTTMVRARAANTLPSRRATWGCAQCVRFPTRASTGRIWPTSVSFH